MKGVTDLAWHAELRAWREGPAVTEMIDAVAETSDHQQWAQELVERACAEGVELIGLRGLLTGLTKSEHFPLRLSQGVGQAQQRLCGRLHRADQGHRGGAVRRVHRDLGRRDPPDHLKHQRYR